MKTLFNSFPYGMACLCAALASLLLILVIAWTFEKVGHDIDEENDEDTHN